MPARLTPMERYLRRNSTDRRAKYEAKREALGLVRCTVWLPADACERFKREARETVEAFAATQDPPAGD